MSKDLSLIALLTILLLPMLFFGCVPQGDKGEISKDYKDFFSLSLQKQHDEFLKLPVEKQFDIYIYAMTKRHPPDLSFANDIASSGEKVIPFLIDKLEEESESIQQKIILIFEMMARYHSNNLKVSKNLITLLEKVVSSMEQPLYRERSNQSLEVIKEKWKDRTEE